MRTHEIKITFTGVDEATDMEALETLWHQYPGAEMAVLAGSATKGRERKPRFPSRAKIGALAALGKQLGRSVALHLCGPYARAANAGEHAGLVKLAEGFTRVQVNARSADYDMEALARLADKIESCRQVIVQTRARPPRAPQARALGALFDRSGGRGVEGIEAWERPLDGNGRVGFAGGLGPHNIDHALERVQGWGADTWLDMESAVRSAEQFDLRKVAAVCTKAWGAGEERKR